MSRLVSTDNGRTYTWVGLTAADVANLAFILTDAQPQKDAEADCMMALDKADHDDHVADLVASAHCQALSRAARELCRAIDTATYVQP